MSLAASSVGRLLRRVAVPSGSSALAVKVYWFLPAPLESIQILFASVPCHPNFAHADQTRSNDSVHRSHVTLQGWQPVPSRS